METHGGALAGSASDRTNRKRWLSLSFLHFANDLHSGVLPTIIPMLGQSISLTFSQAGVLSSIFGMIHIFGQPMLGFIADRQKRPYNAAMGPVLCAVGACFLPMAPSFLSAILLVVLLGIGTAMFHPQGTGLCGRTAGNGSLAFFIAVFAACGTLGSTIGPVYMVYAERTLGQSGLPVMALPILLVCVYFFLHYGSDETKKKNGVHLADGLREFYREALDILSRIYGVITIATVRDSANLGIRIFIPSLIVAQGGTLEQGSQLVFAVTLAGTAAGMAGGKLADRIGYDKILVGAISCSPVFLLASFNSKGVLSVALLLGGFLFLLASSSVTTAMSQQRCTGARSMSSSLSMGLSGGLANLFTLPVGIVRTV